MASVIDLHIESLVRDGQPVLDNVVWRVEHGEHWVVLGANGAGKSSLLNVVAGYDWPSRGSVTVLGQTYGACDMRSVKEQIGWVSSSLGTWLPQRQSAREVAATGLYATIGNWHQLSDADLAFGDQALECIGAATYRHKSYGVLSQGEKQRVMIARALIRNPRLLILDEPCSGLDPGAREHLVDDIERMCGLAKGPTVVLVSHHIEEIPRSVTHALLLKDGRVLRSGFVREAIQDEVLSALYDYCCSVGSHDGRYHILPFNARN